MANGPLKGILENINLEVARLPDPALRHLIPNLAAAERELAEELKLWLKMYNPEMTFTKYHMINSLRQLREAIKVIESTRPNMVAALKIGGVQGKALQVAHLDKALNAFHQHFSLDMNPPPLAVASRLSEKLTMETFARSAAKWSQNAVNNFKRNLAIGTLRGESFGQMTDRMLGLDRRSQAAAAAEHLEDKAEAISYEQFRRMRVDANRVVRTEVIAAYNRHAEDGIKQVAEQDPRMMKRWVAEIDGRTCEDCEAKDGEVVDVNDSFSDGDDPPLHPNCRCTVVAWREDWDEQKGVKPLDHEPSDGTISSTSGDD